MGFILSVSLLPVGSFAALALAWFAVMAATAFARVQPLRVIRNSFVALPFALAAVPLIFTRDGDPLGTIDLGLFALTVSGEGLRMFATILLKSWISVQAATLLVFTTPFHDLIHGLERLRLPQLMVSVVSLMYRYLSVLTDEATRMLRARAARSAVMPGGKQPSTIWRAKVVGHMVGALFIRSYERSERIYTAMQSRGYSGRLVHHGVRPMATGEWLALGLITVGLVAFELTAHTWMPHA